MKNINLKDIDHTKHIKLNGDISYPRDLLMVEQLTHSEDDNYEQNYVQKWRIVFLGAFDAAEVTSILHNHFYRFQECSWYQRVSQPNIDGHFTVSGGLDI
jgi:hypothetical protein